MRYGFEALAAGMAAAVLCAGSTHAVEVTAAALAPPGAASTAVDACTGLDAGTVLAVELVEPVSSANARSGDAVRLRTAESVACNGGSALPAGVTVVGEVLHAAPAGRWQKAGELTIVARHLHWEGRRYAVRALRLGGTAGRRELSTAREIFAPQISGHDLVLQAGTRASAKLAESIGLPSPAASMDTVP